MLHHHEKLSFQVQSFHCMINTIPEYQLCLIWRMFKTINLYFEQLKKQKHFTDYPFDKLNQVIVEAVQNGFM